MAKGGSLLVIYGAIVANVLIAAGKFIVAAVTGSSAMLSEAIHSSVDTADGLLLLAGVRLSRRPADENHPFGHGREIYFWSMIVGIVIFGAGGGMSIYEGIVHLLHPRRIESPLWNYVVLGLAAVFEGISWALALRHFLATRESGRGVFESIRRRSPAQPRPPLPPRALARRSRARGEAHRARDSRTPSRHPPDLPRGRGIAERARILTFTCRARSPRPRSRARCRVSRAITGPSRTPIN